MSDCSLFWRIYSEHQANLDKRASVDAVSWGFEEGLNYLLASHPEVADEATVTRKINNAARRSRYASAWKAKNISIQPSRQDNSAFLEARSRLRLLKRALPTSTITLLLEVATGAEHAQLAAKLGLSLAGLRTRLARARNAAARSAA